MWIGDGGLFQIFIHTAAAPNEPAFQFNRYSRAAPQIVMMVGLLIDCRVMGDPFDSMFRDVLLSLFAGGNLFTITPAVDDFRLIAPGIDLDFEIMRGLSR